MRNMAHHCGTTEKFRKGMNDGKMSMPQKRQKGRSGENTVETNFKLVTIDKWPPEDMSDHVTYVQLKRVEDGDMDGGIRPLAAESDGNQSIRTVVNDIDADVTVTIKTEDMDDTVGDESERNDIRILGAESGSEDVIESRPTQFNDMNPDLTIETDDMDDDDTSDDPESEDAETYSWTVVNQKLVLTEDNQSLLSAEEETDQDHVVTPPQTDNSDGLTDTDQPRPSQHTDNSDEMTGAGQHRPFPQHENNSDELTGADQHRPFPQRAVNNGELTGADQSIPLPRQTDNSDGRTGADQHKPFSCNSCEDTFCTQSELSKHEVKHAETNGLNREVRKLKCNTRSGLKRHLSVHSNANLKRHKKLRAGTQSDAKTDTFSCRECEKTFTSEEDLKVHTRQIHSAKYSTCDQCGKQFTALQFKRHQRVHAKPTCSDCGKVFKRFSTLTKHRAVHDREEPSCEECGKTFKNHYHLKQHKQSHTEEKLFACEVCGYTYKNGGNLKQHQRKHALKPFICLHCRKCFVNEERLQRHLLTHSRELSCSQCSHTFSSASTLKRHLLVHARSKTFSCTECGLKFLQFVTLKQHQLLHASRTHPN